VALAVLAAGCGGSSHRSSAANPTQPTGSKVSSAADKCTTDKAGGQLTFAVFSETRGLDPTVSTGSGTTGGTELQAIYDTLMRYDLATNTFVPRVATSLTPNADYSQWTIKLRPGVKFGDGNPLTTEAVKKSIARHQDPANHSVVLSDTSHITNMQTVDDLTMVFTLDGPWGTFPSVLADLGGMVVDTTVLDRMGKDAFNKNPRGAGVGPFEIARWAPGEEIAMEPKKDYWGGPVCIQTLRFIHAPTEDDTYSKLKLGEVQAAYTRDPRVAARTKADGLSHYSEAVGLGDVALINDGLHNPVTADVRLRQAIAAAIDPRVIDTRVNAGQGLPTSAILPKDSPIYGGVDGPAYDPQKAKQLVQEVKSGGWNGKLNVVCPNTNDEGLVIQALLQAVGIDAALASLPRAEHVRRTTITGEYDVACGGPSVSVSSPITRLDRYFGPTNTFTGFRNDEFNAALKVVKAAGTTTQMKAAMSNLQQVWNRTIPTAVVGAIETMIYWGKTVHGLEFNQNATAYFGGAYIK
jgi:peptide/nickel transport system substrate-binding protein